MWGPCENQKLSLNERIKIVKCNRLKDKLVTFLYFLCSLVPVIAGLYFVQKLDTALNYDETQWFHWTNACEDSDSVKAVLNRSRILYYCLLICAVLRIP